jgi:hypothetical protein
VKQTVNLWLDKYGQDIRKKPVHEFMDMAKKIVYNRSKEHELWHKIIFDYESFDDVVQQCLLFMCEHQHRFPRARIWSIYKNATYRLKQWLDSNRTQAKHYYNETTLDALIERQAKDVVDIRDLLKGLPNRLKKIVYKRIDGQAQIGKDQDYLERHQTQLCRAWLPMALRLADSPIRVHV